MTGKNGLGDEGWPLRWRLGLVGAAVLAHLIMIGALFSGYLDGLSVITDGGLRGLDFFAIYEAGHRALTGEFLYWGGFAEPEVTPYANAYRYVPVFAYWFAGPINLAPHWPAYWGWVAFNELLLGLNAYTTWRITRGHKWGAVARAMWFVFTPLLLHQYMGQFTFLMATAVFWVGVGMIWQQEEVAAPPWLISLVTKTNSAVLAPLFLRLGWWRALAGGAILLVINAPYFLWRREEWHLFYQMNFEGRLSESGDRLAAFTAGDHGGVALLRNAYLATDADATDMPVAIGLALALMVLALTLQATFLTRAPDTLALFALWMSAYFFFYHVWEFDYVLLLPVFVLLVAFRPEIRPWALSAFVFVALPTPYWLMNHVYNTGPVPEGLGLARVQDVWPAWGVGVYHASKIVPVAVLWGMLAVSQVRNGVWLPWRSIARSDAAADWRPIVATSGLLALAVTAVVMAISLIAPAAAEADPACQEAPSVCWAVRGYLSAQGADPSQMEELHFDHVSVSGNAAVVSVRFPAADQPSIGIYTLVLDKGVWIVTRP